MELDVVLRYTVVVMMMVVIMRVCVGTRMPMLPARPCLDPPPLPVSSWWRLPGTALQQAPEDGQLAVKARFSILSQIRLKLAEATTAEFSSYRNNIIKIYIRKADIISTLPQL